MIKGVHEKLDSLQKHVERVETRLDDLASKMVAPAVKNEFLEWISASHLLEHFKSFTIVDEEQREVSYDMQISSDILVAVSVKNLKYNDFTTEVELTHKSEKVQGLIAQVDDGMVFTPAPFADQAKVMNEEDEHLFYRGLAKLSETHKLFLFKKEQGKLQQCSFKPTEIAKAAEQINNAAAVDEPPSELL